MPNSPGAIVLASAMKSGNTWALVLDSFGGLGDAIFLYRSDCVGVSGISTNGFPGSAYGYVAVLGSASAIGGGGGSSTLAGLTDVLLTSPADQDELVFSLADNKWKNQPETGGGGGTQDDFTFVQVATATTWSITHNLNAYPALVVISSGGNTPVLGTVQYLSRSSLQVTFSTARAGSAFLVSRSDATFIFTQASPSSSWSITHNLNGYPIVRVLDGSGNTITGSVSYTDLNSLTITFLSSHSGEADLII